MEMKNEKIGSGKKEESSLNLKKKVQPFFLVKSIFFNTPLPPQHSYTVNDWLLVSWTQHFFSYSFLLKANIKTLSFL